LQTPDQFNQQQLLANMFNPQAPGGGQQGGDQTQNLKMWIDWMREQRASDIRQNPDIQLRAYQAAQQASDPVRYAQEQQTARLATDPWGPGGLFEGRTAAATMTPAQIMASQGMNAKNQWASQLPSGTVTPSGVDADELRRLNEAQKGRFRTYM
jgi:hypothetical protein